MSFLELDLQKFDEKILYVDVLHLIYYGTYDTFTALTETEIISYKYTWYHQTGRITKIQQPYHIWLSEANA